MEHVDKFADVAEPEVETGILEDEAETHGIQTLQSPQECGEFLTPDHSVAFIVVSVTHEKSQSKKQRRRKKKEVKERVQGLERNCNRFVLESHLRYSSLSAIILT